MGQSDRSFGSGWTFARVLALIICSCAVASVPAVAGSKKSRLTKLVIYQFEDRVPPTTDVVPIASPNGNLSEIQFGFLAAFDHPLRVGFDVNSTVVGKASGLTTFLPDFSLYITSLFVINTPHYSGTISIQGIKDPQGTGELVITGGSGDFRFARGYDDAITVSPDPYLSIYKNTFTIRY